MFYLPNDETFISCRKPKYYWLDDGAESAQILSQQMFRYFTVKVTNLTGRGEVRLILWLPWTRPLNFMEIPPVCVGIYLVSTATANCGNASMLASSYLSFSFSRFLSYFKAVAFTIRKNHYLVQTNSACMIWSGEKLAKKGLFYLWSVYLICRPAVSLGNNFWAEEPNINWHLAKKRHSALSVG